MPLLPCRFNPEDIVSDANFPNPDAVEELQDFFSREEFLAYFDIFQPIPGGGRNLEGLCKVARPQPENGKRRVNYLCLTFVVDTPEHGLEDQIARLLGKLNAKAFQHHIPSLKSMTSVPCSARRASNYIHQMDLIFGRDEEINLREVIPLIMFTLRQCTGMKTEKPQWWDEDAIKMGPSEAEKANWGNRLRALMGVFRK